MDVNAQQTAQRIALTWYMDRAAKSKLPLLLFLQIFIIHALVNGYSFIQFYPFLHFYKFPSLKMKTYKGSRKKSYFLNGSAIRGEVVKPLELFVKIEKFPTAIKLEGGGVRP